MLPFQLIGQPEYGDALQLLGPGRDLELLVLYHGELTRRAFLGRILAAAGYQEPGKELHLLEWPASDDLDLAGLIRRTGATKIILFGYIPRRLGLHFEVANYVPITVAGITYLFADSLEFIEQTKDSGDNRAAGSLWGAMKTSFLRQPLS
ncbi:hypothetical protein CLV84_1614 [Neolewinella xylanilytica]|uniref:Uncharacterized protein n=1 Tax=Neolewinella xylanilytica TaxID=1514080 RepID=A0A2S6IAW1_9BACT|nr:hypothetical protein [Neolewinella xylanilytica]PPK88644.1 hypothetical protein CLV84_1614 [Neolewinella xylanilytica]